MTKSPLNKASNISETETLTSLSKYKTVQNDGKLLWIPPNNTTGILFEGKLRKKLLYKSGKDCKQTKH